MPNVVYLHGRPRTIAHFVRIGVSGHRQLEQLLEAGRLPIRRLIVDAGVFEKQKDLISALRQSGREIVLDTNVAELSSTGRFLGAAKGAPWANPEGPLTRVHFRTGTNELDVVGKIARFAVEHGLQRVHAPARLITGSKDDWFKADQEACHALRRALDSQGGPHIAIDYPLMMSNATLNDPDERKGFVVALDSLPIDSVWLRISGFGGDATAPGMRKYMSAVRDFHVLGKPMISDGVGGLTALALLAFGAVSGIAHGVAEKERFDSSSWNKAPDPEREGGGNSYTVLLNGIDRLLNKSDANALMRAPSARRLCSCHDRDCCPNGFDDTIKDPKGHFLRQRSRQVAQLSAIPEQRRTQHFLDTDLAAADRLARQIAKLRIGSPELGVALTKNAERIDRVRAVLENLAKITEGAAWASEFPEQTDRHMQNRNRR